MLIRRIHHLINHSAESRGVNMFDCCNTKFSELKNKPVIDKNGQKVGRVADFVVAFSNNRLELRSVILAGGRMEEFLESVGLKPNDDPVFGLGCMDRVEESVHLACERKSLKTLLDKDAIEKDEMKMSQLAKLKAIDLDGIKLGNVIDVWFDRSDRMWLVLGGGFVEETLEKLGAQPDIDLLVPQEAIKGFSKKEISLKWTKFQLRSNCEKEYERYKREISSTHQPGDARYAQLRLTGQPTRGTI